MDYFFQYGLEGAERFFTVFDTVHFITLSISILIIGFMILKRKAIHENSKKDLIGLILAILLLFLDFSYYYWKWINGHQTYFPMPMHVCSWATYLVAVSLVIKNKHFFHFALFYGFTGGVLSSLIPDFGGYSFDHMRFYQFMLLHLLLVIGPLYQLLAYKFEVKYKYAFYVMGLMIFQAVLAYYVNTYIGELTGRVTNMMFTFRPPVDISIMPPSPYYHIMFVFLFLGYWFGIYKLLNIKRFRNY